MAGGSIAGRTVPRVYRTSGRADLLRFLESAVGAAGGTVLYASEAVRAPVYLGVEFGDERVGVLCYPFRATQRLIQNRPADEHRLQIRYGAESTWKRAHPLAFDVAGVDATVVLGLHLDAGIILGLDPLLYDPLPMGISIEFKDADVKATTRRGWHAWERINRRGSRRSSPRAEDGMETVIGFTPENFARYVRFERAAADLGLDPVLRYRAATKAPIPRRKAGTQHALEETFHLSSAELLELISKRKRLTVAVRGGVAEHHLVKALRRDRNVVSVHEVDADGPPDVEVRLRGGRRIRVECKNGNQYANGDGRVEVQKTRASKGDPASRFYRRDQFDVLAVCMWSARGPRFVYRNIRDLATHAGHSDRLAVMHRIDASWASRLGDAL